MDNIRDNPRLYVLLNKGIQDLGWLSATGGTFLAAGPHLVRSLVADRYGFSLVARWGSVIVTQGVLAALLARYVTYRFRKRVQWARRTGQEDPPMRALEFCSVS